ncbi:MAG: histidine--tRNA ligase [Opitutales bacterium]
MEFETLPGFRAFPPDACVRRDYVFDRWRTVARTFDFLEYDTPVLEPLELYVEKSGEEIVGQLFNFQDRGGRTVALRPEMTPSLARIAGARANSLKRPVKWFNIGEHYRYERPQKGRLRAFYQLNADILGEPGPGADAELILMLIQVFRKFGLGANDFTVRLSDRDLWLWTLRAEGLDEAASLSVLGVIDKLERMKREEAIARLEPLMGDRAAPFLDRVADIVAIRESDALGELVEDLALKGDEAEAARKRVEEWGELLARLKEAGVEEYVRIDLGVVRGLAYYTGFVFEAFEATGEGRALAGGGRYDKLVRKLGGPDMPAVGFAMGDVTLVDLLEAKGLLPEGIPTPQFTAIIGGPGSRAAALHDAAVLREQGHTVDYPLKEQNFGKQFKSANQKGTRFALIYGSEELERGVVRVRDLQSGAEREIDREVLPGEASSLLADGIPADDA